MSTEAEDEARRLELNLGLACGQQGARTGMETWTAGVPGGLGTLHRAPALLLILMRTLQLLFLTEWTGDDLHQNRPWALVRSSPPLRSASAPTGQEPTVPVLNELPHSSLCKLGSLHPYPPLLEVRKQHG